MANEIGVTMTFQNIVAFLIILGALAYVGSMLWRKTKSFSPKSGCASDCGCGSESKKSQPVN